MKSIIAVVSGHAVRCCLFSGGYRYFKIYDYAVDYAVLSG